MPQDSQDIIGQVTSRVFTPLLADYLASERFLRLCRADDLEDNWKEYLELSRDRPDLYGDEVMKSAFVLFLHHIFHDRYEAFPGRFTGILLDFSREMDQILPLADLKEDLRTLGYPREELEKNFSAMTADEEERRKRRKSSCPG